MFRTLRILPSLFAWRTNLCISSSISFRQPSHLLPNDVHTDVVESFRPICLDMLPPMSISGRKTASCTHRFSVELCATRALVLCACPDQDLTVVSTHRPLIPSLISRVPFLQASQRSRRNLLASLSLSHHLLNVHSCSSPRRPAVRPPRTHVFAPARAHYRRRPHSRTPTSGRILLSQFSQYFLRFAETSTWSQPTTSGRAPLRREMHSATRLSRSRILIAGGRGSDGTVLSDGAILDTDTWRWEPCKLPGNAFPRCAHSLTCGPGALKLYGGFTGEDVDGLLFSLDPGEDVLAFP
jgi:hypothetical protein